MRKQQNRIKNCLAIMDKTFWAIDTVIYIIMIAVVLLQIFARVCLPKVPAWTEEASRFLQIYMISFGAGIAVKYNAFVSVDTIFNFVSKKTSFIIKMINNVVVLILFAFIFKSSFGFYLLGIPRTAVSMPNITMNLIYFSMILMSFSVLFGSVRKQMELYLLYRNEVNS